MPAWYPPNNVPPFGASGQTVSTATLSAITGTLADAGPTFTVPANTAAAGVTYEVHSVMKITAVGTANTDTYTFSLYYGGIAGTALVSNVLVNASGGVVGGTTFVECSAYVRFSSVTACLAYLRTDGEILDVTTSGNGFNLTSGASSATVTGLTTTANKVLTVGLSIAPTTGTPSVTPIMAFARRVA